MIAIGQMHGDHEVVVKNTFLEFKQDEITCDESDINAGGRRNRIFSDTFIEYSSSGYDTDRSETGSFTIDSGDEDDLSDSGNWSAGSGWSKSKKHTPQLKWADITEEDSDCLPTEAQVSISQQWPKDRTKTKPVAEKLKPVQQSGRLDGQWNEGWICGHKLIWNDGEVTELRFTNSRTIIMTFEGKVCQGTLLAPGILRWDDGDLWYMLEQSTQRMTYAHANQMRLPCLGSWHSSQQRAQQHQRWM